jgi:hypothetical protein
MNGHAELLIDEIIKYPSGILTIIIPKTVAYATFCDEIRTINDTSKAKISALKILIKIIDFSMF